MQPSRIVWLVIGIALALFATHLYVAAPMNYISLMDEPYYLLVAHYMLTGTVCVPPVAQPPYSCNFEHPPLAKALVALGIWILGNDTYGWRISSMLSGSLSIPLLYFIAYKLSDDRRLSILAAGFLSLDTLFFAQSSVAMLDVPETFFGLAAFAVYLYRFRLGPVNGNVLAGAILALSILSKETGVFLLASLVTFHLFFTGGSLRERTKGATEIILASLAVFAVMLQVYDSIFTTYPFFFDQVLYILRFGSSFKSPTPLPLLSLLSDNQLVYNFVIQAQGCMSCARSGPLDWITFYYPIDFLNLPLYNFSFYLIADVPIMWAVYAWIPLAVLSLRKESLRSLAGPARLSAFALVWLVWNFVPYLFLYAYGRYMFLWYLIPAVPALSLGAAYLVTRRWFPRWLLVAYIGLVLLWFLFFFPDKDLLSLLIPA